MTNVSELFSLEGKTAVVTGTSAGLGIRLARTLALAGARVAAIARRRTELDEEAMSTGRVHPLTADLAEPDQVRVAASQCLEAFDGRVDILVNNAAYLAVGVKAEDESYEDIRRTLAVNVGLNALEHLGEHLDHRLGWYRPVPPSRIRCDQRWLGGADA